MNVRSLGYVGATSVATGVLAYATLIVVARVGSESAYVAFAVLWAAYYGVAAAFAGLQQDVTRTVLERRHDGPPLWRPTSLIILLVAAVTAASAPWWGRSVGVDGPIAAVLLSAICALGGLVVVLGVLAAERNWRTWSILLLLDASLRLTAVTTAVSVGAGLAWQAAAIGSGALVWLPGAARWLARDLRSGPWGPAVSSGLTAMSATALAALVVAGLPLLAAATTQDDLAPSLAGLLAALVLFRSPVLLVVNAYRPMLVVQIVDGGRGLGPPVWRLWRVVGLGGLPLAAAGYVVGPWLLRVTWGPDFRVSGTSAALLVVGAVALTLLTVSSTGLIASGRAGVATVSWALTFVVTVLALLGPDSDKDRILAAALLGPLPAVVWHAVLLHAGRVGERQS